MTTQSLHFSKLAESAVAVLREAANARSAAPGLVPLLCGWFDCQWGTYWHVDSARSLLRPAYSWNNELCRVEKLRHDTDARSLTLSEGTAGQVWRMGVPVCTGNLVRDMCLPRSLYAGEAGLRGGIWFPIRSDQVTYGVMELLSRQHVMCDERFMKELAVLGAELGNVCMNKLREAAPTAPQYS